MPASPRVPPHLLTRHPDSTLPPAPHTPDEIRALVAMLHTAGASTISISRGRHPTSAATADALTDAWTRAGRTVLDTVDWPERAASWLKPARQLEAGFAFDRAKGLENCVMTLTVPPA